MTGATRGLGKGIAVGLGEAGATVYVTGRSLDRPTTESSNIGGTLRDTQADIEAVGGTCIPVQVDHADDDAVRELFDRLDREQSGQLDVLVNNVFAGVEAIAAAAGQPFWKAEPSLWDAVNQVGLRSHYVASVFAARLMRQRGQGFICNVSSWGGLSYIFGAAYGAGKAACDRLAADMAVELKADGITALSVWPGIVATEHLSRFADSATGDASDTSVQQTVMGDRYNWETPRFAGRAIAALAADPNLPRYGGTVQVVAELARRYNFTDVDGSRPASLRSLRFLLPARFPALRPHAALVPDLLLPGFLLQRFALQSPKL